MKTVTRDELQRLLNQKDVTLVEALPARYYQAEHLPGARHLPHDQVAELAATVLPNRDDVIVVYCASSTCQNSHIAAEALSRLGYRDVAVYPGGKQDWAEAGLPLEGAGH